MNEQLNMRHSAIFAIYNLLVCFAKSYKNPPNQVAGTQCVTPNQLSGNCVTLDSQGHNDACAKLNGFFVSGDGICAQSGV